MELKDNLVGTWETKPIRLIVLIAYVVDFKRDGRLLARPIYKNRLFNAIYTFVEFRVEGEWGAIDSGKINIAFDKASWTPSRMADQVLRTLKIHISTDELISTVASSFFRLIGVGPSGGEVTVTLVNDNSIDIGGLTFYRRR